jgi:hypothetical protein
MIIEAEQRKGFVFARAKWTSPRDPTHGRFVRDLRVTTRALVPAPGDDGIKEYLLDSRSSRKIGIRASVALGLTRSMAELPYCASMTDSVVDRGGRAARGRRAEDREVAFDPFLPRLGARRFSPAIWRKKERCS